MRVARPPGKSFFVACCTSLLLLIAPEVALGQVSQGQASQQAVAKGDARATPAEPAESGDVGFLLGEDYRYDELGAVYRVMADVVAIPANVGRWDAGDWALTLGTGAVVGGLMLPLDPSPDVALDRWITREVDPWMPDIWQYQAFLWGPLAVGGVGTWGLAWLRGWNDVAESMSLAGEALAVAQVYHLSLKLLIGREGPQDGQGRGLVLGPTASAELFPAGTPSGHFATLYSLWAALEGYWRPDLLLAVPVHAGLAVLASTHVLNHRHYLSDIVWGSAMGYAIGHWVVRHRSTRLEYVDGEPVRIVVVPHPGGLAVAGSF